jgi:hypothetical protein
MQILSQQLHFLEIVPMLLLQIVVLFQVQLVQILELGHLLSLNL